MDNSQITVNDLVALRNIIDLASSRGAFQGSELRQIGEVYDRLSQFLEAVAAQAQQTDGTESDQSQGE